MSSPCTAPTPTHTFHAPTELSTYLSTHPTTPLTDIALNISLTSIKADYDQALSNLLSSWMTPIRSLPAATLRSLTLNFNLPNPRNACGVGSVSMVQLFLISVSTDIWQRSGETRDCKIVLGTWVEEKRWKPGRPENWTEKGELAGGVKTLELWAVKEGGAEMERIDPMRSV
ncbi:hypothetical protein CC80DRAFT_583571 [Byssothecium circinans]|uniref:Uncharacterized protein n=1 Tax=Byssothecium circinans TaxID=147558 RepID=A0A6A5T909_9PLEO|nr:hypothetical protein CC80DRAFT_583571 [Byssothecium circinans]